jgi:beta-N-acetylhexosaminidase
MIVARYSGTTPSAEFLQRVRDRKIGGVILFGDNTRDGTDETKSAIASLQHAAHYAGSYPLLVMTDQEGGTVKRLPDDPPALAANRMDSSSNARTEGYMTGTALRKIGVNLDLAPVADVEQIPNSFLGARAFGSTAEVVEERACAFAGGLAAAGVGYTLKHFPGLGAAPANTDLQPVVVDSSKRSLRSYYGAYRKCGRGSRTVVMISSADYPRLTGSYTPAVLSPEIYNQELPAASVSAPTISDDLDAGAIANLRTPARRAIDAGLDLLLYAQNEASSSAAYAQLLADLGEGRIDRTKVVRAAAAVTTLKRTLIAR